MSLYCTVVHCLLCVGGMTGYSISCVHVLPRRVQIEGFNLMDPKFQYTPIDAISLNFDLCGDSQFNRLLSTRGASGSTVVFWEVCVCMCQCVSRQAESTPSIQNSSIPEYTRYKNIENVML